MDERTRKERRFEVRESGESAELFREEKRKFTRIECKANVEFLTCDENLLHETGDIENVSQVGVLVRVTEPPVVGSVVALKWDEQAMAEIINVQRLLHEDNGEVLGEIVRVTAAPETEEYEVAIHFLKKGL